MMAERETRVLPTGVPSWDIVIMGPPGAGKGTQAKLFRETTGWTHLSTGDLFRQHLRLGTDLGRIARSYMDKGDYVPDDVTVRMVRDFIRERPLDERLMFDGFPRTVAQAVELDRLLADKGRHIGRVLLLDVPRPELERRMLSRAHQEGRTDDTPDIIRRRFDVYEDQTRPVLDHYEQRGLLQRVPAIGSVEEVNALLRQAAR
jgi:adenylate kinase